MRYEVIISATNLYLTPAQARNLIGNINSIYDFDGIQINTGFEYDSLIEDEGSDSEEFFTNVKFYINEDTEIAIGIARKVMDGIKKKHKEIRKNGLFFTLTDVNNIEQYN